MSCCEDPLMIVKRRNLDFETVVLLGTVDGWDAGVLRCCVDKGRCCFPPPRRMEH